MLAAVLVNHIVDDLLPPVVLEVHVYVRHFLALHIQEALEDQPVRQRIDIGHAQAVKRQARRRAAPHREEDVALPHELGDVPHN